MERYAAAFTALGGFTAIGILFDLAMWSQEKAALKARLEDWWKQFSDANWRNFSRKEAMIAIEILDRFADQRLWSWRRWFFSVEVAGAVFGLAAIWILTRIVVTLVRDESSLVDLSIMLDATIARTGTWYNFFAPFVVLVIGIVVAFAISISVTRRVALAVAQVSTTTWYAVGAFVALLAIHVLLFIVWSSTILASLIYALGSFASALIHNFGGPLNPEWPQIHLKTYFDQIWPPSVERVLDDWRLVLRVYMPNMNPIAIDGAFKATYKFAMDLVSNGVRVAFALIFLATFLARPIHYRLSAILYNSINSRTPFFTLLFGAIGAIVGAVSALVKTGDDLRL
jgi:hypothetical protein